MTQRELDHIRKREHWRTIIADQKESGQTVIDYCREKRIAPSSFHYWKTAVTRELLLDAAKVGILHVPPTVAGANEVVDAALDALAEAKKAASDDDLRWRELRRDAVYMLFDNVADRTDGDHTSVSQDKIREQLHVARPRAAVLMHWMEQKGIVDRYSGNLKSRKLRLTREQWEQHKDELLDTDVTVQQLLHGCENSMPPISAHVEPVAEAKNIDTQQQLSVDGVVFDMEHNRLYVPGNATEQTISVAINILRGLIPQPAVAAPVLT